MKKLFVLLALLMLAAPTFAAETRATGSIDYTDFSNGYGDRRVASLETVTKFDTTSLVLSGSHGERNVSQGESFDGQRISGQLYVDWSDTFYTRTLVGLGTNSPVFARRDFAQDFNYKLNPQTVVLLGARYTDYFGDVNVKAYSAGVTQYFGDRFNGTYRFTRYDSDRTGSNNGHLVMLRLRDSEGQGTTQMWLGYADTLYAADYLPELIGEGSQRSVVLRRVQPLGTSASLNLVLGKTWYETPVVDFQGVQVGVGVTLGW